MKNIISSISAALILSSLTSFGGKPIQSPITVDAYKIERVAGSVNISLRITSAKGDRCSYKTIAEPVVIRNGQRIAMQPIVFRTNKGRIIDFRHRTQYAQGTILADKGQTIDYQYTTPYKAWLYESHVMMDVRTEGCNKTHVNQPLHVATIELKPDTIYIVKASLAYLEPAAEKKTRTETGSAYLEFPTGSARLIGDFKNNAYELSKINSSITIVNSDKGNKTLESIDLWGTSSPEGSSTLNAKLSQGRALALRDYIATNYLYPTSRFSVSSTPENWNGLQTLLANSFEPWAGQVIDIATSTVSDDTKDKMVKAIDNGATYRYLLTNIYPELRRVDYRVNYIIRDFTPTEVAAIYKSRPADLSANELYALAKMYAKGSAEFQNIIETAAALYPTNEAVNINAANSAIENGNLQNAARYLSRIKSNSKYYYNTLGALEMLEGQYPKAQQSLSKAQTMGLKQAAQNLEQIATKLKNIETIRNQ